MKVLITGSTASQTLSGSKNTFANFLFDSLAFQQGHEVSFQSNPSVNTTMEELETYDKVLVGIAPPTSVTAYKVYPAFSTAYKAWKLGNLEMFIDAPEPHKLQASINSCRSGKSDLTRDFYSRRKSYSELISENQLQNEIAGFIEFLFGRAWPRTYYPAFPWCKPYIYETSLVMGGKSLVPVSVDGWVFETTPTPKETASSERYWVVDSASTPWTRGIKQTIRENIVPVQQKRLESQEDVMKRISMAVGSLVSVYRNSQPWWSSLLAESLQAGVPVATDWRHTASMGSDWTYLASSIEEMPRKERKELASFQKETYLRHIPTWEESSESLTGLLKGVSYDSYAV